MPTFLKRPVAVEMIQWTGTNLAEVVAFTDPLAMPEVSNVATGSAPPALTFWCEQSKAQVLVEAGGWVVRERGDGRGYYPMTEHDQADSYDPEPADTDESAADRLRALVTGDPVDAVRWLFTEHEAVTDTQRLAIFEIVQRATHF